MAVKLTHDWKVLDPKTLSFNYGGLAFSFEICVDAKYVDSGSNVQLYWRGWLRNLNNNGWTGTNKNYRFVLKDLTTGITVYDSGAIQDSATIPAGSSRHLPSDDGTTASALLLNPTHRYRIEYTYNITVGGSITCSEEVYFEYVTAPTGLNVSNIVPGTDNFKATVSITGWGGAGNANTRYRELQVWTYSASDLVAPRRFQLAYGDSLSSIITCSNSSEGYLTIQPNTRYVIGAYASNGTLNTGSVRKGDAITLAPAPTLSRNSVAPNQIKLNYTIPADGGAATKTCQYQTGSGSWETFATVNTGNSSSGTITKTGLNANTNYDFTPKTVTSAGTTFGAKLTVATAPPAPTISLGSVSLNTATINYTIPADGGAYTKTLSYRINGGAWISVASISDKTQTSGTFTLTNLELGKEYVVEAKTTTTAGDTTSSSTVRFTTEVANPTITLLASHTDSLTVRATIPRTGDTSIQRTLHLILPDETEITAAEPEPYGNAFSIDRTITELNPRTPYLFTVYVSVGSSESERITESFTTKTIARYVSYLEKTKLPLKRYASFNGNTKLVVKRYCSVDGKTKLMEK